MTKLLGAVLAIFLPALALAGPAHYYDHPDTSYATNVVIDIIEHAGGIWFATGEGVNFSLDSGETWLLYNTSNGLVGNDVSAIYSGGSRLWVATNHVGTINGGEEVFSDGLSYTDNLGETWVNPDYSDTTRYPKYFTGPFRTIYDITGAPNFRGHDWVFAAAFAGGLLGSNDTGKTWHRLFATRDDSLNFSDSYNGLDTLWWRNRLFSVVADTSHGDTLYLWAGTAGGILQFVFLQPQDKFSARSIRKIAICESCTGSANNYAWFGGVNGVTSGRTTGQPFHTRFFSSDFPTALNSSRATAMQEFGGKLFLGIGDSTSDFSEGLFVSIDQGSSYQSVTFPEVSGANRTIEDIAVVGSRLYLAGEQAGLWVSSDTGDTWNQLYLDSSATSITNRRNVTHALESLGDTLFVGTDSGLTMLFLDGTGSIDSARNYIPPTDSSSLSVHEIKIQLFTDSVSLQNDSFYIWTINRPDIGGGRQTVSVSKNRGLNWSYYLANGAVYDIEPINVPKDIVHNVYFVGPSGIKFVSMGLDTSVIENAIVRDAADTTLLLSTDTVYAVVSRGDTVIFGGNRGAALSKDRGRTYRIYGTYPNAMKADIVVSYTVTTTINNDSTGAKAGMLGNFIPALGIQYQASGSARIVASCRPTTSGGNGVSVGKVVPVTDTLSGDTIGYKYRWDIVYFRNFAWNINAYGDSLFLPTDDGLLVGWNLLDEANRQFDTVAFTNAEGRDLVFPGTPTYAALAAEPFLWVGSDDGTIRIRLSDLTDQRLFIQTDSTPETYAFPVPFSPNRDDLVRFHFEVPTTGAVTLEIFDFAMNLVATPIENVTFDAGTYPPGPGGDQRPYWNGRNDQGDLVAVGMYYFRLTFANGESTWGKLAVVP